MTDVWVCGTCHSINRQRDPSCYKCGSPQDVATGAYADLRVQRALQTRTVVPYRSSWLRFSIAAVLIVATAIFGLVVLIMSADLVAFSRDQIRVAATTGQIDEAGFVQRSLDLLVPALLGGLTGLAALVYFAAWLSRVTMNIPALGGGVPGTTPTKAFIYPLIPIWNLFKVPPMVQDALYRLDPKAGGFFMFVVAWVGIVGSAIVSFVADWWVNLRITSLAANSRTVDEFVDGAQAAYDIQVVVDVATTIASLAGALVLVIVMFRIERRAMARNEEIKAAAPETITSAIDQIPMIPNAAADNAAIAAAAASATTGAATGAVAVAAPDGDNPPSAGHVPPAAPAASDAPMPDPVATPWIAAGGRRPVPDAPAAGADPAAPAADEGATPHLQIEVGKGHIRATLDGETEDLTLVRLRQTAEALARVGGRATIRQSAIDDQTDALAHDALQILRDAGVVSAFETT